MRMSNTEKDVREKSDTRPVAKGDFGPGGEPEQAGIEGKTLRRARRLAAIGNKRKLVAAEGNNPKHKMVAAEVSIKQTHDSKIPVQVAYSSNFESMPVFVVVQSRNGDVRGEVKVVIVGLDGRIAGKDPPPGWWIGCSGCGRTGATRRRVIGGGGDRGLRAGLCIREKWGLWRLLRETGRRNQQQGGQGEDLLYLG